MNKKQCEVKLADCDPDKTAWSTCLMCDAACCFECSILMQRWASQTCRRVCWKCVYIKVVVRQAGVMRKNESANV